MSDAVKKKSYLFPALVIGGVALWYFFGRKETVQPPPDITTVTEFDPLTGQPVTPPIVADNAQVTALQSNVAIADRAALIQYDPANRVKYEQMNDAETITAYNYFFGYLIMGKKLYQYPNATGIFPDGGYDTNLYNQVKALQSKYGIYL